MSEIGDGCPEKSRGGKRVSKKEKRERREIWKDGLNGERERNPLFYLKLHKRKNKLKEHKKEEIILFK